MAPERVSRSERDNFTTDRRSSGTKRKDGVTNILETAR
jgi:hypothetical protein